MLNQKPLIFISICFFTLTTSLFSKSKKNETLKKYLHPRVYEIDLTDSENKVYLLYDNNTSVFSGELTFTHLVKYDKPQAGDKIIFYYEGYVSKNAGKLTAKLFDKSFPPLNSGLHSYNSLAENQNRLVTENAIKDEPFKGSISFILTSDLKEDLVLVFYSDLKNQKGKLDQTHITFKRVKESVNTFQEQEALQKAEKKKLEIEEVEEEITDDYSLEIEEDDDNETERLLEQERLAKEKEELERQRLLQEELQEALKNAEKSDVERYAKEYLQDYMIQDKVEVLNEVSIVSDEIEDPNLTDSFGRTLLMKASGEGNDWKVKKLLKAGAKVNEKDKDGWTALMYAVRYQDGLDCVNLLLNNGSDVKAKNIFDSSALSIASSYNKNPLVLKKLLSYYQPSEKEVIKSFTLLLSDNQDSEYVLISKVNEFINTSIPINSYYEGKTPLMYACLYGSSTKVIQLLLDHNSIVTLRSPEGLTAYDYAKQNKNLNYDKTYWILNQ